MRDERLLRGKKVERECVEAERCSGRKEVRGRKDEERMKCNKVTIYV